MPVHAVWEEGVQQDVKAMGYQRPEITTLWPDMMRISLRASGCRPTAGIAGEIWTGSETIDNGVQTNGKTALF